MIEDEGPSLLVETIGAVVVAAVVWQVEMGRIGADWHTFLDYMPRCYVLAVRAVFPTRRGGDLKAGN